LCRLLSGSRDIWGKYREKSVRKNENDMAGQISNPDRDEVTRTLENKNLWYGKDCGTYEDL